MGTMALIAVLPMALILALARVGSHAATLDRVELPDPPRMIPENDPARIQATALSAGIDPAILAELKARQGARKGRSTSANDDTDSECYKGYMIAGEPSCAMEHDLYWIESAAGCTDAINAFNEPQSGVKPDLHVGKTEWGGCGWSACPQPFANSAFPRGCFYYWNAGWTLFSPPSMTTQSKVTSSDSICICGDRFKERCRPTCSLDPSKQFIKSCFGACDTNQKFYDLSTKDKCEEAATHLNLADQTATTIELNGYPKGCWYKQDWDRLYWNRAGQDDFKETNIVSLCSCDPPTTAPTVAPTTAPTTAPTVAPTESPTTITTTATSTASTEELGRFLCMDKDGGDDKYLGHRAGTATCTKQAERINAVIEECQDKHQQGVSNPLSCEIYKGEEIFVTPNENVCKRTATALNVMVLEYAHARPDGAYKSQIKCDGTHLVDEEDCAKTASYVNGLYELTARAGNIWGASIECDMTTITTTATSTMSLTRVSTVSSTGSSTASTTQSNTATSATSTASTTQSYTGTTQSSTATSTMTGTQTTSISQTETSTASSTASATLSSTMSNTGSTTLTSTATTTPQCAGAKFGSIVLAIDADMYTHGEEQFFREDAILKVNAILDTVSAKGDRYLGFEWLTATLGDTRVVCATLRIGSIIVDLNAPTEASYAVKKMMAEVVSVAITFQELRITGVKSDDTYFVIANGLTTEAPTPDVSELLKNSASLVNLKKVLAADKEELAGLQTKTQERASAATSAVYADFVKAALVSAADTDTVAVGEIAKQTGLTQVDFDTAGINATASGEYTVAQVVEAFAYANTAGASAKLAAKAKVSDAQAKDQLVAFTATLTANALYDAKAIIAAAAMAEKGDGCIKDFALIKFISDVDAQNEVLGCACLAGVTADDMNAADANGDLCLNVAELAALLLESPSGEAQTVVEGLVLITANKNYADSGDRSKETNEQLKELTKIAQKLDQKNEDVTRAGAVVNKAEPPAEEDNNTMMIIAAAAVFLLLILVIVVAKRSGSGAPRDRMPRDGTAVFFENPLYAAETSQEGLATDGLYDEVEFNDPAGSGGGGGGGASMFGGGGLYDDMEGAGYLNVAPEDSSEEDGSEDEESSEESSQEEDSESEFEDE